jgi:hypothetical protein
MASDEISEEGRRQRFARWEQLGVDQVKHDLLNGGHRVVGGPPAVRELAWEWVRMKEAEQTPETTPPTTAGLVFAEQHGSSYTMRAAKAVYQAIETLTTTGRRAYSLSVPLEAENTLVKTAAGGISRADAAREVRTAIVALAAEGKIEAHAEGRKDWVIREPLQHDRPPQEAEISGPLKSSNVESQSELFTLKPSLWGMSVDLKEVWRRIRRRLQRRKSKQ